MSADSELYEKVVCSILSNLRQRLGYKNVDGSTCPLGKDGNKDQVDVTAHTDDGRTILIECRRCGRKATKDHVRAFAGKVSNLSADEGIIVNCKGFQVGAIKAAHYLGIKMATLGPDATEHEYDLKLVDLVHAGRSASVAIAPSATASAQVIAGRSASVAIAPSATASAQVIRVDGTREPPV